MHSCLAIPCKIMTMVVMKKMCAKNQNWKKNLALNDQNLLTLFFFLMKKKINFVVSSLMR